MGTITSLNTRKAEIAIAALEKLTIADIGALDFQQASKLHNLCKRWQTSTDNHLKLQIGMVPVYWPWSPKP